MKIKTITIENIGPFVGRNEFSIDISEKSKRMVLIGGKNGAGKTTLFNAIKVCLYGCVTYGFETNNAKYYEEIENIINASEKLQNGEAGVCIELLMDDGKDNHIYKFERNWKIKRKKISEIFQLSKDGEVVSEAEKSDFESFFLHMIPPDLFRFYFFDGEKISDFVFNNHKNSDFKDAFLKLCNLDTMDIVCENFRRISRVKSKDSANISKEYDKCVADDNLLSERMMSAEDEYKEISEEIAMIDGKLASLEKKYAKTGGISKKEWRSMQERIAKEELRREENRKWLKDIANNVLPFIILQPQLKELQKQIEVEHKAQMDANVKNAIDTPPMKDMIANVLKTAGVELAGDITDKIIDEIIDYTSKTSTIEPILNLSDLDRYELNSKINSLNSFDIDRIKTATDNIEASLKHVKRIRKKMECSSVDHYETYLQAKSDLNEKKAEKMAELAKMDLQLQKYRSDKAVSSSKLAKAKSDYEVLLKKQSINDLSARALLAFDELQSILYKKSIQQVEQSFQEFFGFLINKSDLIECHSLNNIPISFFKFYSSL